MAARRLSQLQRQLLRCLLVHSQRTRGGIIMGHFELVKALGRDKSNVSHSLCTLEARGLIVIRRTPGGQASSVDLTAEGRNVASKLR